MAGNDVYLRSGEVSPNDVRLRDPTLADSAGGSITATLNVTEADDTISAAGAVLVTATLSVTESADTLSAAATLPVIATLTVTEGDDTLSAAAGNLVTATLTATEAADTLSGAAVAIVGASLAVTEAADALSGAAAVLVQATLAATQADDSLTADGTVASAGGINASLTVTEDDDALSATGTVVPAAEVYEGSSGGFVRFAGRHSIIGRHYRPVRLAAKKAIDKLNRGEAIDGIVNDMAANAAALVKAAPDTAIFATAQDILRETAYAASKVRAEASYLEIKAALQRIEAAATKYETDLADEDDAIVAILLAA